MTSTFPFLFPTSKPLLTHVNASAHEPHVRWPVPMHCDSHQAALALTLHALFGVDHCMHCVLYGAALALILACLVFQMRLLWE